MKAQPLAYRFADCVLAADGTLLLRQGQPLTLPPKVLRTLLVLVERAGRVVSKSDLLHAVWPDSFVEEGGIARNVSILRQALGDDGASFIATVPKIGYRFLPGIQVVDDLTGWPSAPTGEPASPPPSDHLRSWNGLRLVGRDEHLRLLDERAARLRAGGGGVVAVAGEPGIGKSTLVEEFLAGRAGVRRVGRGRCSERLAGAEAHLPVLEALASLLAGHDSLGAPLRLHAPSWFADVAAADAGSTRADAGAARAAGSVEHLLRELTAFLAAAASAEPVVLLIEDLHWADLATVDVIAHLAPRLVEVPVLLVITYRTNELAPAEHPFNRLRLQLLAQRLLQEISLPLLNQADVADYVRDRLGGGHGDVATAVHRRTGGNPLFMSDLVRYLQEHGSVVASGDLSRELPASLRGMIDRTLQGLGTDALHVLRAAAVSGHEFESAVLARALEREPAAVEETLQTLDESHGLVVVERDHRLPDGSFSRRYRFVHVLYQEAVDAALTPSRRAQMAGRLAAALTEVYGLQTDGIAAVLALLWQLARDPWRASQQYLAASKIAARRFAFSEAIELARRGLECLDEPGVRDQPDARRRECDLLFARAVPLASLKGYGAPEVEELTSEMLRLGEGLADTSVASAALGAIWMVKMVRGECQAARRASEQLVALAKTAGDDVLLMNGHMQAMIACHHLGDFGPAQRHADAAIALDATGHHATRCLTIFDPIVAALAESSRNLWITGHLSRALEHAARAVALGEELGHPGSLAFAWLFQAWLHGQRQEWPACVEAAARGEAIGSESGTVQTLMWNRCVRGWALAHLGRHVEGLQALVDGIAGSHAIMGQVAMPQITVMRAEALLAAGDVGAAADACDEAMAAACRYEDHYYTAEVHRVLAVCRLAQGDRTTAGAILHRALEYAQDQGASLFELRAALTLADVDPNEGRSAVREALSTIPQPIAWLETNAARRLLEGETDRRDR